MSIYSRVLLFLICLISLSASSQQELTLHFNRDAIQSSFTNPAFQNKYKVIITLPSVVYNYGNNAFSYYDLIATDPNDDSTFFDIDGILAKMSDDNIIQVQSYLDWISLGFTVKDWFFSFNLTHKIDLKMTYRRDMVDLLWNGNDQFIGETIEIGPGLNMQVYKEFGFRVGRHFEKFDVGMRAKWLNGIANLHSVKNSLQITTGNQNFESTLSSDYEIREAGLEELALGQFSPANGSTNLGYAFDFGGVYRFNEKWEVAASVIDLGRIEWNTSVKIHKSHGTFTFSGIDINDFINDNEFDSEAIEDSLSDLYFSTEESNSYISNLIPKTYLSGSYHIDEKTTFGALFQADYFNGIQPGVALYAGRDLSEFLQLGLSYSYKNRSFANVGFNMNLGMPAFRLYLTTDNLLTFLRMGHGKNVTFRYGLNINLGRIGMKKKKRTKEKIEQDVDQVPEVIKQPSEK